MKRKFEVGIDEEYIQEEAERILGRELTEDELNYVTYEIRRFFEEYMAKDVPYLIKGAPIVVQEEKAEENPLLNAMGEYLLRTMSDKEIVKFFKYWYADDPDYYDDSEGIPDEAYNHPHEFFRRWLHDDAQPDEIYNLFHDKYTKEGAVKTTDINDTQTEIILGDIGLDMVMDWGENKVISASIDHKDIKVDRAEANVVLGIANEREDRDMDMGM